MKLSVKEFDAMQMGWRKWYIEKIELKTFKKFGLKISGSDILEVGCGNGYAASLITAELPHSYTGLDIMPEQLAIAKDRNLPNAVFVEGSADDLSQFPDRSFDVILDFCILHHVEGWRTFFDESRRVLKDGGSIYIADLSRQCIHIVDAVLHWGHAEEALFSLKEFETEANQRGFETFHKANDLGLEGYFRFRKK
ncbi:MAG: class I SAM-dependent methyltransferase [Erysipelotrichaceae bacterium]|nr:class I SAM-dependent methyltransferase [Erysipelotrichaceae bacterium]